MPSPRFDRLPAEQRRAIEQAAREEFASYGFHEASLNRIIQAAGISKGSLYYYFDGKEDLYAHVARVGLEDLFGHLDLSGLPDLTDPADADTFWAGITALYLRATTALAADPQLARLLRGWTAAAASPTGQRLLAELEEWTRPWVHATIEIGQGCGAVRTDVPLDLLLAATTGLGQALDTWLLTVDPDPSELPRLTALLIDLVRGGLQPS